MYLWSNSRVLDSRNGNINERLTSNTFQVLSTGFIRHDGCTRCKGRGGHLLRHHQLGRRSIQVGPHKALFSHWCCSLFGRIARGKNPVYDAIRSGTMSYIPGQKEIQENGGSEVRFFEEFSRIKLCMFSIFMKEWNCGTSTRHSLIFEYATLALVEIMELFEAFAMCRCG